MSFQSNPSRRDVVKFGLLTGVGLVAGTSRGLWAEELARLEQLPLITKAIPSSGVKIPVVGIGTNQYNLAADQRDSLRDTMKRFVELGGSVYDTATGYARGESEAVLGELSSELKLRDKLFFVTKVVAPENNIETGRAGFATSLERLKTNVLDGLLVHNLAGTDVLMPAFQEWKQQGKIRHLGISTSSERQYDALAAELTRHKLDIVQIDYSLGNRGAADRLLPLAMDRGAAVMINLPFGGRRGASVNFPKLASVPLPGYAADFDIKTWPQFFLKYVVSHPAVTIAIPGTRRVSYVEDNMGAARGRLPDAAARKKMEETFDALPA
ncbi:MAG: aldo/keto reductase [Gemmatimonadales bacterium]|nr:aldo/keto reductase [Gemmatimonadales bacterium]